MDNVNVKRADQASSTTTATLSRRPVADPDLAVAFETYSVVNTLGNQSRAPPATSAVNYNIYGHAYITGSTLQDRTSSDLEVPVNNVTAGNPFSAAVLAFTGCQQITEANLRSKTRLLGGSRFCFRFRNCHVLGCGTFCSFFDY